MTKVEMLEFVRAKIKLIRREQDLRISDIIYRKARMEREITTKELQKEQERLATALAAVVEDLEFLKRV